MVINFDLPPELKNGAGRGRDCSVGPGEEVELGDLRIIEMMLGKMMMEVVVTVMTDDDVDDGADADDADRPCLPSLAVLEVEGSDEVVVAPNMLRHKVNLKSIIILDPNHGCGVDRREIYITCNWTIHPMMVFIRENMFFPPWLSKCGDYIYLIPQRNVCS